MSGKAIPFQYSKTYDPDDEFLVIECPSEAIAHIFDHNDAEKPVAEIFSHWNGGVALRFAEPVQDSAQAPPTEHIFKAAKLLTTNLCHLTQTDSGSMAEIGGGAITSSVPPPNPDAVTIVGRFSDTIELKATEVPAEYVERLVDDQSGQGVCTVSSVLAELPVSRHTLACLIADANVYFKPGHPYDRVLYPSEWHLDADSEGDVPAVVALVRKLAGQFDIDQAIVLNGETTLELRDAIAMNAELSVGEADRALLTCLDLTHDQRVQYVLAAMDGQTDALQTVVGAEGFSARVNKPVLHGLIAASKLRTSEDATTRDASCAEAADLRDAAVNESLASNSYGADSDPHADLMMTRTESFRACGAHVVEHDGLVYLMSDLLTAYRRAREATGNLSLPPLDDGDQLPLDSVARLTVLLNLAQKPHWTVSELAPLVGPVMGGGSLGQLVVQFGRPVLWATEGGEQVYCKP
ncbi:hypothetical protein J8273_4729 [Carpediemonas membranifera]|uniref:Uncharacterized protein n=1 Tax=Carpediemonas membranifera TaxID=201153 RepID=A0A8J6E9V5_9EUKA|nr:hypothetical protein J8273_4729 [Carpediemonas membranifera]|eukprot:KAG9393865.1 hypothetical protein J8273_4729 [Carpediemonas membranifera]